MASGKFADLYDDAPAPVVDMGPEARRARAGGSPSQPKELTAEQAGTMSGPLMTDITAAGPIKNELTTRPLREREAMSPEEQKALPEADARERGSFVRTLIGGAAGGMAAGAAGAAAGRVSPTIAPLASGAVGGAAGSAVMGGSPLVGAAVGGLLGAAGGAAGELASARGDLAARLEAGAFRDFGRHASEAEKAALLRLGPGRAVDVMRRAGVIGAPDAGTAHASVMAKLAEVGDLQRRAFDSIGVAHGRPLGGVMVAGNKAQEALRGTRAGNEIADAVHDEMIRLFETHGGNKASVIPLGTLRRELTDSQGLGYSGAKYAALPEASQKVAARVLSRVLGEELDSGLTSAAADPATAAAAEVVRKSTPDLHALMVLKDVTGRAATKAPFRGGAPETIKQRIGLQAPSASNQPIKMPTGYSMATPQGPQRVAPAPAPAVSSAGAAALSTKDNDAINSWLHGELFGATAQ